MLRKRCDKQCPQYCIFRIFGYLANFRPTVAVTTTNWDYTFATQQLYYTFLVINTTLQTQHNYSAFLVINTTTQTQHNYYAFLVINPSENWLLPGVTWYDEI